MMPGGFAVVNTSKNIDPLQADLMCKAIERQIREDVAPLWSRLPCTPRFFADPSQIPGGMARMLLTDTTGDPRFDAWHTEAGGLVMGVVCVAKILEAGGGVLHGETCVAKGLGHEVIEAMLDPWCNAYAYDPRTGLFWPQEMCDLDQLGTYDKGDGISLCNFGLPRWLDAQAPATEPVDFITYAVESDLGEWANGLTTRPLDGPFSIAPGGYGEPMRPDGTVELRGERPAWKISLRAQRRRERLAA